MELPRLPIDDVLPELLERLRAAGNVVLRAPTGAGKTTRVPGALLDSGLAGAKRVVVLEPRRMAARAAARRVAHERGGAVGEETGWRVRFAGRPGARPRPPFVPRRAPQAAPARRSPHLARARRELGFEPKPGLEAGLQHTIDWFRQLNANAGA